MSDVKNKICPHCLGWMSEHPDYKLKKAGWIKCNTCRFSKNIKENMHKEKVDKNQ